jgi:ABC-type polysaccharide/polyol phosphate transport system ATPase subunit
MTSKIITDNLSIKFRLYHNRLPTLKEYFASLLQREKKNAYSDYWAVNNISLEINCGERLGIIGHNGAGKSTLLKALCKIYHPTSGSIQVSGRIAPLLEIGAGFHPEFTGRENIYLNGSILGYNKRNLKQIEASIIDFAELHEFIDTPVKYYSTGMYTRLAFSLATAVNPDILILDEMFAGGDASFVQKATARMKAIIDQANILVMVSHNMKLLASLCDRVIWLDRGQLIADGRAGEVIELYEKSQIVV